MENNYFTELNSINVSGHVEKKNNLSYLSWAWAWAEVKTLHPDAVYTIYENKDGWIYHTDGRTCWVKTGVTINGIEHIEYLPVMDFKNKSIPVEQVTSIDVNKAIQRSLTKACARHGLGLYIYAGEDLPEADKKEVDEFQKNATAEKSAKTRALNKALQTGEYIEPKKKLSVQERYEKALAWIDTMVEWKPSNSARDSINDLLKDLYDADRDKYETLAKIVADKDNAKLDDYIPD
jgi:hypothetical protein